MTGSLGDRQKRLHAAVRRFERDTRPGMQGVRLTIRDDSAAGGAGFDRVFAQLGATIDAFPEALRDAVPTIRAAHRAVFRSQGAAGRGSWDPLTARTLRERARLGFPPGPILKRTGALQSHVLTAPATIRRRRGSVELVIAPGPVVDGVPKYRALAKGHGNLPGRPMVAIGPDQAKRITSSISRSLRRIAARNGIR